MQNKANFRKAKMKLNFYSTKDYENEPRLCKPGKQSQTKPIFLPPKARLGVGKSVARSGKVCTRLGGEKVTDNGLTQLSKMDKLNQLILTGNFTDDALLYLERLPTISILDILEGANFSPEAVQRFRRNMPELRTFRPNMLSAMRQQQTPQRPIPTPLR